MDAKTARQTDRFSQFALAAGTAGDRRRGHRDGQARSAARRPVRGLRRSALGGIAYAEQQHERYMDRGIRAVAPNLALAVFGGAAPANLGIALGLHGPILSTANSCAAGAVAIGEAFRLIRSGGADAALAGGVEVPLSPLAFGAFDIIRALRAGPQRSTDARPSGRSTRARRVRDGRGRRAARARGLRRWRGSAAPPRTPSCAATPPRATLSTWSSRGPTASRLRAPRGWRLPTDRMKAADVDYVNAHASSTPLGDTVEARAIARALGPRARTVPVSGTKAYYGHPLGASGAIEACICSLAIARGWAPGTVNLDDPDPAATEFLPGLLCRAAGRRNSAACCRLRSASAASTPRWLSAPSTSDK